MNVEQTVRKWLYDQHVLIMLEGHTTAREARLHTLEDVVNLWCDTDG